MDRGESQLLVLGERGREEGRENKIKVGKGKGMLTRKEILL